MRIKDFTDNAAKSIQGMTVKDDRKTSSSGGTDFQNSLKHAEGVNYEEHLEGLARQIADQGQKLANKVDVRELRVYKKLISEFLSEAVGHSMKFSKQSLLDRRGRHKVYALIKKINSELDLLTQDVVSEERDNIGILKRIEDIRGLILDMFL